MSPLSRQSRLPASAGPLYHAMLRSELEHRVEAHGRGTGERAGDAGAALKRADVEYHRRVAAEYDEAVTRHFSTYHDHALEPWAEAVAAAGGPARVLDLGTGTGAAAVRLARHGCSVEAVDHSIDMLARAQQHAARAGLSDSIRFGVGDAEKLAFADESFDAVCIQGLLHHLPDPRAALAETHRVLRPGGRLFVSEPCREAALLGRVVRGLLQVGRRVARGQREDPPQPHVSDHEAPLAGGALLSAVREVGFDARAEFLVNLGAIRFLPRPMRIWAVLAVSLPTRRRHGDLAFITAVKRRP